jgi:hypothetical protein
MTPESLMKDLIVLAADGQMRAALERLLESRNGALRIRKISVAIPTHPLRDPGMIHSGPELLQAQRGNYRHALTICDRHGCGRDKLPREDIERLIEARLTSDWGDRAAAIVIDPELENWVWADSPHVAEAIGWPGGMPALRIWLRERGYLAEGQAKPSKPKEALEEALRTTRNKRSSSLYQSLAERVTLTGCADPAFLKLCATLQRWFPSAPPRP